MIYRMKIPVVIYYYRRRSKPISAGPKELEQFKEEKEITAPSGSFSEQPSVDLSEHSSIRNPLQDFFAGFKVVLMDSKGNSGDDEFDFTNLKRHIIAFGGVVDDEIKQATEYIITNSPFVTAKMMQKFKDCMKKGVKKSSREIRFINVEYMIRCMVEKRWIGDVYPFEVKQNVEEPEPPFMD